MGNQQPKLTRPSKMQIEVGTLKAKIHLELMRDRKNAEVIKGQKDLLAKIKNKSRNKAEEILIAERIINGLKYAQACNMLIAYNISLKPQAQFLSENIFNQQKIQPWLMQIYSILYSADRLGISSLNQFKSLMKSINDPTVQLKYVNPQLIILLSPTPTSEELNTYFLEMAERNNLPLEEINMVGHKFTKNPSGIPSMPSGFEKNLNDIINHEYQNNNQGGNPGNNQPNPYGDNHYGNNYGNQQPYNPTNQPNYIPYMPPINPYGLNQDINKKLPQIYHPQQKQPIHKQQNRFSISDINQIDYYPEIQPPKVIPNMNADFDQICFEIQKGL